MPREEIRDPEGSYSIKVGWAPEQGVQVGAAHPEGKSLYWVMLGDSGHALATLGEQIRKLGLVAHEDDEALGRAVLNTLDTINVVVFDSLWSNLDRHRLNRLIRLLRKARDAAFGRDE